MKTPQIVATQADTTYTVEIFQDITNQDTGDTERLNFYYREFACQSDAIKWLINTLGFEFDSGAEGCLQRCVDGSEVIDYSYGVDGTYYVSYDMAREHYARSGDVTVYSFDDQGGQS